MGTLLNPARTRAVQAWVERLVERLKPWSWLWPPMAFAAGLGSFFLVNRQQWLGVALAVGLLVAWLLLLSESLIGGCWPGAATLPCPRALPLSLPR